MFPSSSVQPHPYRICALVMSSSKMSTEQVKQALGFLQSLQQSGHLGELLSQLATTSMEKDVGGSMSDASKRRLDEVSVASDDFIPINLSEEIETVEHKDMGPQQMPKLPKSTSLAAVEGSFPPGIESLEHWSTTLCELPKVASLKKTYGQLLKTAASDPDMKNYLKWILKYKGPSDRTLDLAAFLKASGFEQGQAYFPGGEVRRFG